MATAWKSEEGHLVCRWSEVGEQAPYNAPWMQATQNVNPKPHGPACLDFKRLSPFGGPNWYDPRRGFGQPDCAFRVLA